MQVLEKPNLTRLYCIFVLIGINLTLKKR